MRRRKQATRAAPGAHPHLIADDLEQDQPRQEPVRRSSRCRCGQAPLPGLAWCAVCHAEIAKLWTTPPCFDHGLCRRVE